MGLWNGLAIAVTCGLGVYLWSGLLGLVMVIAMIVAGMAGALVPITLKNLVRTPQWHPRSC